MPSPVFKENGAVIQSVFGELLPPDLDWLASAEPEEILLPDLPIVDAHHHLWERPSYPYLIPEFAADLATGHNVVATVYADCGSFYRGDGPELLRPVGETEFVVGQAAQSASGRYGRTRIAEALFGYADLTRGQGVREVLDAHVAAGNGRFRGVRFQANWDGSGQIRGGAPATGPHLLVADQVLTGLRVLADMRLVLDVYVFFNQLRDVVEAARAVPGLTIVLNHCGGPLGYGPYATNQDEHYRTWKSGMLAAAREPNVVCKLCGVLNRSASWDYLHADRPATSRQIAEAWRRWIEPCIEAFGPERCMFESNYPVEKVGTSYAAIWNAYKQLSAQASEGERQALFSATAARTYGLAL